MRGLVIRMLRRQAMAHGRLVGLWRRLGRPGLEDWAEYLRRHGGFHAMGTGCAINPGTVFANPALIRMGDNVRIAGAHLAGHDGSVNMINRCRGLSLDNVGPIRIGSHVFIGVHSIILPGVTIGDRVIVGAGAVVARDVESDSVVVGAPARKVATFEEHVARLAERNAGYPWRELIERRGSGYDAALEPELQRMRVAHFFGDAEDA